MQKNVNMLIIFHNYKIINNKSKKIVFKKQFNIKRNFIYLKEIK